MASNTSKKNVGKRFEEDFKNSVPSDCFIHRLKDSAQSYSNSSDTLFSWDNPFDYFLFDCRARTLYCLELKSTKSTSISYQQCKEDNSKRMIKWHQIQSLIDASKYDNIVSGLVLNFRNESNNDQRTYFFEINDFIKTKKSNDKHSINEIDILMNGGKKIHGNIKRTRYHWDIESFLRDYNK